jgi:hypothetical protein
MTMKKNQEKETRFYLRNSEYSLLIIKHFKLSWMIWRRFDLIQSLEVAM